MEGGMGKLGLDREVSALLSVMSMLLDPNFSFKEPLMLWVQNQLPSGPKIPVSSFMRTQDTGCPALPVCARWYNT